MLAIARFLNDCKSKTQCEKIGVEVKSLSTPLGSDDPTPGTNGKQVIVLDGKHVFHTHAAVQLGDLLTAKGESKVLLLHLN